MKKTRSITSLKKNEYETGAHLALNNAENLFELAQHAYSNGVNGSSVSLMITSLEELAKSAYLMIKAHHPNIIMKELDAFFWSHRIKHEVIVRLFNKLVLGNLSELPEEEQDNAALLVGISYLVIGFMLSSKGISIDIEGIRKRGYYVNFDREGGEEVWKSPHNLVDSVALSQYLEIGENIFKSVKKDLFSGKLSDVHTKKYLDELCDENVYFRKTYKFSEDLSDPHST